ncbi:IS21-like element helper ATPase IstB [Kyrpidia spormannii]|uniref:AAA family ATPase n=4 Tax=Kyrpidia spormannii TaxID=2055160 RepID=A0A6F9DZH5_9BACL|nr:IS21-like element helper ATPase IstB [Kyrpidia spormannii]CAB3389555.1 AAA family ATPase [Kyrpidia spormannii]CAB3389958.1 AAA family ATPase [Kyrpidia spormannii]CAB3390400.1 AAA family ATPase [Kyrpidia spormannii]CAB3390858.1 AAA family ATPase [Kyrpidia spormannii]CAB3394966.1 AAA family ATPase [Kyrpidia spormannii]
MTTELLLAHYLKQLRLPTVAKQYASLAREAAEHNLSYEAYLVTLFEQEVTAREENQRQLRLRHAAFPVQKTLDTFEFHLVPSLSKQKVLTLAQGEFVERHANVLLIGSSGTGKTHLATALGVEMVQRGYRVKFVTACALVEELLLAKDEHRLLAMEKQWLKYDVVICDELGYVPFTKAGGELLFQFFSDRHERRSTIVTSNLEFGEWVSVFGDEKLTAALLDRMTHRAHILVMNGESYRFRQSLQRQNADEAGG